MGYLATVVYWEYPVRSEIVPCQNDFALLLNLIFAQAAYKDLCRQSDAYDAWLWCGGGYADCFVADFGARGGVRAFDETPYQFRSERCRRQLGHVSDRNGLTTVIGAWLRRSSWDQRDGDVSAGRHERGYGFKKFERPIFNNRFDT